jgi:putative DNA primase/helicase
MASLRAKRCRNMLEAALRYSIQGKAVFPLNGKVPLRGSRGFHDATADVTTIRKLWKENPGANIGFPTGQVNGVFVVDIDGPEGEATLADLEKKNGPLPRTYTVLTGRGRHRYFRQPPEAQVKSGAGILGPKLDVRGDGGYVVAPPSIHPETRRPYEVISDCQPAEAPPWLIKMVRADTPKKEKRGDKGPDNKIPKGQQNDWLTKRAGSYRRAGDGQETIEEKLLIDYEKECEPPHDAKDEVRKIARGIERYPACSFERNQTLFKRDVANAALFAKMHEGYLLYCAEQKIWYAWDGKRFAANDTGEVMRRARATVRRMYEEALGEPDDEQRKKRMTWALQSESRLEKIVEYARSEKALEVRKFNDTFDLDPYLFNCANGILNLKTGELAAHNSQARLTKITKIAYNAEATCPRFEQWLLDGCGSSENLQAYLIRFMGYCLSGLTEEQSFWMLYGPTKTGKSTFVKLMRNLLGEYATSLPESAVVVNRFGNPEHALAELANVRLATLVEIAQGKSYDEAKLKQITGQDWIGASKKYQNYFEFISKAKLIIATNHPPAVRETDDSFWNRVKPVPFRNQVPAENRIENLDLHLIEEEGPGILNLVAAGFRRWRAEGLNEPQEVTSATNQYRTDQNLVVNFIEECCVRGEGEKEAAATLFRNFISWKEANGINISWTKKQFGLEMKRLGYVSQKSGNHFWLGLRLRSDREPSSCFSL